MRYLSLFQFEFLPFIVCCRASLGAGPDATCEGGHVCTFPLAVRGRRAHLPEPGWESVLCPQT